MKTYVQRRIILEHVSARNGWTLRLVARTVRAGTGVHVPDSGALRSRAALSNLTRNRYRFEADFAKRSGGRADGAGGPARVQLYGLRCSGMLDMTSFRRHTFRVGDGDRYDGPPASRSPTCGSGSMRSGCLPAAPSDDVFRLGFSRPPAAAAAADSSDDWLILRGLTAACLRSICSMSTVLDRNTAPPSPTAYGADLCSASCVKEWKLQ